jgi:hypothetical protein
MKMVVIVTDYPLKLAIMDPHKSEVFKRNGGK